MIVTSDFAAIENDLFADKQVDIYKIVNKHILTESLEGNSKCALDLAIHYGVMNYLVILQHEYTTVTGITVDELKTLFDYDKLKDCLYCKGYKLDDYLEQIIS